MIDTLDEKDGVTARKSHNCDLCGLVIPQGSTYYAARCVDGVSAWTWRAHSECSAAELGYWAWAGLDPSYIDPADQIPHDEFRRYLEELKSTTVCHRDGMSKAEPIATEET